MKKILMLSLCMCAYAVGYTTGNEDGIDYQGQYIYNCGSISAALCEAETCLLRITATPHGREKMDQHIEDAFFWIDLAKDMSKEA